MALDNSNVFLYRTPKWGEAREIRHRPLAIIRQNASNRKVSTIFAYFHLSTSPRSRSIVGIFSAQPGSTLLSLFGRFIIFHTSAQGSSIPNPNIGLGMILSSSRY
jgi:hypothetical protein